MAEFGEPVRLPLRSFLKPRPTGPPGRVIRIGTTRAQGSQSDAGLPAVTLSRGSTGLASPCRMRLPVPEPARMLSPYVCAASIEGQDNWVA
jgi:hypothetical protein